MRYRVLCAVRFILPAMKTTVFFSIFVMAAVSLTAQSLEHPRVDGYVTRVASSSDFDVEGLRIFCGDKTHSREPAPMAKPGADSGAAGGKLSTQGCPAHMPYVGQPMKVYGAMKKKEHAVEATLIDAAATKRAEISGSAVIDALLENNAAGTSADGLLVRTDGYAIRIDKRTEVSWGGQLHGLGDVQAGDWIEYKASPAKSRDYYIAEKATIFPVVISSGESKLRAKNDFDPSAVPDSAKQRRLSAELDPKRLPPYRDAAMQARVERIGESLIPRWNQEMPDSNPAKIHFRFQVVDTKRFRDALTLPSGVILISHQVVERMENDDELATVLADNIACALERQTYRLIPATRAANAAWIGGTIAGAFVPGLGLAAGAAAMGGSATALAHLRQQSGRVSLGLLRDAGYDIQQAPLAWWRLETLKREPVTALEMPDRAAYLYFVLGANWTGGVEQAGAEP